MAFREYRPCLLYRGDQSLSALSYRTKPSIADCSISKLLNNFLLRADHRTYDGRRFSLCLVRSAEIHKYQPEGKAVCNFYKEQELFFVYQNDLARANKPPLKMAPPAPASLFRVSLELDEHTVFDKKTCLLRKNGRRNRRVYAEVRCDFSVALHAAISLRKRKVSIIQLQSEAALYGGAVPSKDRKATRSGCKRPYTPCRLTLPEPPTIWNHDSSPCPVFVIDNVPNHVMRPPAYVFLSSYTELFSVESRRLSGFSQPTRR